MRVREVELERGRGFSKKPSLVTPKETLEKVFRVKDMAIFRFVCENENEFHACVRFADPDDPSCDLILLVEFIDKTAAQEIIEKFSLEIDQI